MLQLFKYKKGQAAVTDLFISLVIFSAIIITIIFIWNNYNVKIDEQIKYNDIVIKGFHISDLLSQYTGRPENWDEFGDVDILGLADSPGVISKNKLNNFTNMTYNDIKSKLNIGSFDFYFNLSDAIRTDFPSVAIGNISGEQVIDIRRFVMYENQEAILEFAIWQ